MFYEISNLEEEGDEKMLKIGLVLLFLVALTFNGCFPKPKNRPPSVAEVSCPEEAEVGKKVNISVVATDRNRDKIAYKVAFGDGVQSEWSEFLASGKRKVFQHTYSTARTYGVYAIATDHHRSNSGWSEKTFIKVGKSKWFMYYLSHSGTKISVRTAPVTTSGGEIVIPSSGDWTGQGIVLSQGTGWDKRFYGMLSPCTVIKKNGTYFLYYIGADGNRSTDGGPRHRALGVATSSDGIHFTKYSGNPVLTHLPHNNEEEGIFSAGAFLDDNGEIVMYYSALDAGSSTSTTVDSDVRLAVSNDGLNFTDKGDVISHANSGVWGYGDELFPVGAFREGNTYYVYYIAKGYGANWDLGLGWGPGRGSVGNSTKKVLALSPRILQVDPMYLSVSKIALFICLDNVGQVRTASVTSPGALSGVVGSYSVTQDYPVTVYLDN